MPADFEIEKFIKSVIAFSLITETLGAVALYLAFSQRGMHAPLWTSIFHSVSAFCTAGLSLYADSFERFRGNTPINTVLGILSYLGAIGFIVFVDVWRRINRKTSHVTLTTHIILITTGWVSLVAMILFFTAEPTIQGLPFQERVTVAFFQVMTSVTTVGFNTIPTEQLSHASLFLITMLMIIGASPSGTGGGLKTTTCSAVFGVIKSTLLGRRKIIFWNKEIPDERIRVAIATLGFYVGSLIIGCYLLALTERLPLEALLFESASALGTVGLSTGITAQLTSFGKFILVVLMFIGRLGPLIFGVALFLPHRKLPKTEKEDLVI